MLEKGEKTFSWNSDARRLEPARSADEREHRRPQVEKRKATTKQESTPIEDGWRIAPRQIKKRCQNNSFETAFFNLPKRGFRQHVFLMVVGGGLPSLRSRTSRCAVDPGVSSPASRCAAHGIRHDLHAHLKQKSISCEMLCFFKWWWEVDSNHRKRC